MSQGQPSLREIQELFWRAISHPTGVSEFLQSGSPKERAAFEATFAQSPGFSRIQRVEVYAEGYFYRLLDVLAEMFPLLVWQTGHERFHNLVTDYLLSHPSSSPNLHHLGLALPEFLCAHPLQQELPQLADLARVELEIFKALDGPDSEVLSRERLASIDPSYWPQMQLQLVATVRIVPSRWSYRQFREAQDAGQPVPQVPAQEPPFEILVWRREFTPYTRTLDKAEATLLSALQSGLSFGQASELAQRAGADAARIVHYLGKWLDEQLLAEAVVQSG